MNAQLVKTLAEIIRCLSEEERILLESELQTKPDWIQTRNRIIERGKAISDRLGGNPLNPPPEEVIREMREERTEELMSAILPNGQLRDRDEK